MESFLRLGTNLSHRTVYLSKFKANFTRCMYSSKAKDIFDKYEDVIEYMRISSTTEEKIRKTKYGSVRLDIDNPKLDEMEDSLQNFEEGISSQEQDTNIEKISNKNYVSHSKNNNLSFSKSDLSSNVELVQNMDIISEESISTTHPSFANNSTSNDNIDRSYPITDDNDKLACNKLMQNKKRQNHSFEDSIKIGLKSEDYMKYYIRQSNSAVIGEERNTMTQYDSSDIREEGRKPHIFGNMKLELSKIERIMGMKANPVYKEYTEEMFQDEENLLKNEDTLQAKIKSMKQCRENQMLVKEMRKKKKESKVIKDAETFIMNEENKIQPKKEPEIASHLVSDMRSTSTSDKMYQQILNKIPKLHLCTRHDILKMLRHSVVYKNDDLVGICKPYGIEMHDGASGKRERHNIVDFLPELATKLNMDHLYPVHRLDANTTGVLLLARNQSYATKLKEKFKKGELEKTYVAITKGVPTPAAGVINIFIGERKVDNRVKMDVKPDLPGFRPKHGVDKKAITKYEVLSSTRYNAVVEVKPQTGIKHQIRVHLGVALNCPIMGDHKYSNRNLFVPQKLDNDTMTKLQITQPRVRDLPMYLHASSILIPDTDELKSVRVSAKIPPAFLKCIKILNLNRTRNRITDRREELIL